MPAESQYGDSDLLRALRADRGYDVDRIEDTAALIWALRSAFIKHRFASLDEVIEVNSIVARANRRAKELEAIRLKAEASRPPDTGGDAA